MGRLPFEDEHEQDFDDADNESTLNEDDQYDSGFEEDPKFFAPVPTSRPPRRRRNRSTIPTNNYPALTPQWYDFITRTPDAHISLVRRNDNFVLTMTTAIRVRMEVGNYTITHSYFTRYTITIHKEQKALLGKLLRMRFQK